MAARPLTPETYRSNLERLRPLILEEWPAVDSAALADTAGDLERAVALIAERTGHTRSLVRTQLAELCEVAETRGSGLEGLLQDLEARARRAVDQVRHELLPRAEGRVRQNLLVSLLLAIGLGVILGMFWRGPRRDR